ncbi:MAG TPA: hypothetical protein VMY42_21215 [Thermoguttaceae bacterium]|nr:hypothetical protein [Thermoguttaceae bacterium]
MNRTCLFGIAILAVLGCLFLGVQQQAAAGDDGPAACAADKAAKAKCALKIPHPNLLAKLKAIKGKKCELKPRKAAPKLAGRLQALKAKIGKGKKCGPKARDAADGAEDSPGDGAEDSPSDAAPVPPPPVAGDATT